MSAEEPWDQPPLDALRAVCPRCRRLVVIAQPCALDGADVLAIGDAAARERMVEAIWGTADQRGGLRKLATTHPRGARTGVAAGVGAFAAMSAFDVDPVIAAATAVLGGILATATAGARRTVPVPPDAAPLPSWPRVGCGRITSAGDVIAPGSRLRCAAWAIELRYGGPWGSRTTLRASATAGFDVVLDSGDRVRIASGAMWIDGPLPQVDGDDALVDELLRALDPAGATAELPLFPYNVIGEHTLDSGDRVEVLGEVEGRPATEDPAGLYRDAAPTVLVHKSVPVVRRA